MLKIISIALTLLAATAVYAAPSFEARLDTAGEISDFNLRVMNNTQNPQATWNSADFNDAIYVLEAFFDNCPYCNDNAPLVDEVVTEFADQPRVKIVDLGRDCSESEYRQWIAKHNPNHPVLNDCNETVLGPLGISGYPTTVILDCHLNEVARFVGGWDSNDGRNVRRVITEQLAKECSRS